MRVKKVEVNVEAAWKRFGLVVVFGAVLVWAVVHVSALIRGTQMANKVGDVESLEAGLASDPSRGELHTRLGFYYSYDPFLFDLSRAVRHFEAAARLQPFGYQQWTNLGHVYEQQGESARAERAYQRGIELAPNYFYPRWSYANFLLRQGRIESAFGQFRRVAEIYPDAIGNICDFIWVTTGNSPDALTRFGSSLRSGEARGRICMCLVAHGEYQRAVDLWKTLARAEPTRLKTGRLLVSSLIEAKQWPLAHLVWQHVVKTAASQSGDAPPSDALLWNGDFEDETHVSGFDWHLRSSPKVEVRLDPLEHYRGSQSLLIDFKQHQQVNFSGVSHELWVEPSSRYRLQFYYKTQGLSEINGLAAVLSDVEAPGRFSVESEPLGNQAGWTSRVIVFDTPPETRVLRLSIVRRPVGRIYDYIEGRVWLDTFTLEKVDDGRVGQEAGAEKGKQRVR